MYPEADEFPGFVDIGCGNGVLVSILIQEGYRGWGFDARARRSWTTFPASVQDILSARILVPSVLRTPSSAESASFHNGRFPPGTFIISNHADELTPWTPLLAYLNVSPFIAIPCCSHNLAGARCRFSVREKTSTNKIDGFDQAKMEARVASREEPGPSTGSLARPKNSPKQPSAYQSLTTYVTHLAEELGFKVQREMLRIPSTRNAAIVGRLSEHVSDVEGELHTVEDDLGARSAHIAEMVRREVGEIDKVVKDWLSQTTKLSKSTSGGH
jgi:tRNASer (uridine44-2'-O)-methyltransferase